LKASKKKVVENVDENKEKSGQGQLDKILQRMKLKDGLVPKTARKEILQVDEEHIEIKIDEHFE